MPIPKPITSKNHYVLDRVKDKEGNTYAALTRKNAEFIEAVVALDSNYKRDMTRIPPDKGFNINTDFNKSKGKYCGSIRYWFERMLEPNANYSECVLGAVTSVDRTNSTHLETVLEGRKQMRDRIVRYYPTPERLKKAVAALYRYGKQDHIIYKLTEGGLFSIKDHSEMFFISFASKFITYAAIVFNLGCLHSKYDGVVSTNLPIYAKLYLNKKFGKRRFKVTSDKENFNRKREKGLRMYGEYVSTIDEILSKLREEGILMTKEEFDHIVWYCSKG